MDIHVGRLQFVSALDHPEMMGEPAAASLQNLPGADKVGVSEIDPEFSDTVKFCENYQVAPSDGANCVIIEAERGGQSRLAACVILGSARADINNVARRALDARKVSFAKMERAVSETKMEYGAITPIGLPSDWFILIDRAVVESGYLIIGSGVRKSKLAVPGSVLASLPNAQVLDGLGQPRP